jgi:hypothetical protein
MLLVSGAPDHLEGITVMEMHLEDAANAAIKIVIQIVPTEEQHAKQDVAHGIIDIATPWMIRRWSESNLANGKPPVRKQKVNANAVDLEWRDVQHAKLKSLVKRYTSQGASGV